MRQLNLKLWPAVDIRVVQVNSGHFNCEKHFQGLIAEVTGPEATPTGSPAPDMIPMAQVARKLHLRRIDEIKAQLQEEENEFRNILQEIDEIRSGKWDDKLRAEWKAQHPPVEASAPAEEEDKMEGVQIASESRPTLTEPKPRETSPARRLSTSQQHIPVAAPTPEPKRRGRKPSTAKPPLAPLVVPDAMDVDAPAQPETAVTPKNSAGSSTGSDKKAAAESATGEENAAAAAPVKEIIPSPTKTKGFARRGSIAQPRLTFATDTEGAELDSGAENSDGGNSERKKSLKGDPALQIWRKTVYFILAKIADHRYGNVFGTPVKDDGYHAVVKHSMSLDVVRARVRKGITTTTAQFHRDLLLMFTNAIMYNNEDSEVHSMAQEMKDFVDAEILNLHKYGTDPMRDREKSVDVQHNADGGGGGKAKSEEPDSPVNDK
ncbi:hypothetical protein PhCBS80983_g03508 [Powellomyces hirtus]|uniref:Bromo domain-containing protein n=1 Tax=Powellomyces hirtus TaxID=109895 RepID=A0A507E244_9FUNG|nr:hypothetical protein PhCBS80983_g03508 [Powellomyces hirtus]